MFRFRPVQLRNATRFIARRFKERPEKVLKRDGREKKFKLGWSHMQEKKPRTLQEKWYRVFSVPSQIVNYEALENLTTVQKGARDTEEWRCFFETTSMGASAPEELKQLSPWHDIPLGFINEQGSMVFNFVNEIPKGERAKMECNLKEGMNPLKQDIKKGKLRYFTYGDLPFNYGFLPQTWECPNTENHMTGLVGDNDPIDVVELSPEPIDIGTVTNLKVISIVGMIDEGETDWKVIGINSAHPLADKINTVEDIDTVLGSEVRERIIDWFKMYKTTDGKPENSFYKDGAFLSMEDTNDIIKECHFAWMNLLLGRQGDQAKYSLDSVYYKTLLAQVKEGSVASRSTIFGPV